MVENSDSPTPCQQVGSVVPFATRHTPRVSPRADSWASWWDHSHGAARGTRSGCAAASRRGEFDASPGTGAAFDAPQAWEAPLSGCRHQGSAYRRAQLAIWPVVTDSIPAPAERVVSNLVVESAWAGKWQRMPAIRHGSGGPAWRRRRRMGAPLGLTHCGIKAGGGRVLAEGKGRDWAAAWIQTSARLVSPGGRRQTSGWDAAGRSPSGCSPERQGRTAVLHPCWPRAR